MTKLPYWPYDSLTPTDMLTEFVTNESLQKHIADVIDILAAICAEASAQRGFHDDEDEIKRYLELLPTRITGWQEGAVLQAELARQMSEIAEAVEAVRKPGPDHHLPNFSNFIVEEADTIIRIGDTCGKRQLPIGQAVVAKLLYNQSRPYKHGKQS
jgi:hypothetical protein